jgi:hypothetical protein
VSDDREIVVIGSQAVLGQFRDAPPEMPCRWKSMSSARHHPERAGLIEGSIGELSPFHESFGYYAEGSPRRRPSCRLAGKKRLVPVPVGDVRGLCLEINDLVLSKWAARTRKGRALRAGWPCSTGW